MTEFEIQVLSKLDQLITNQQQTNDFVMILVNRLEVLYITFAFGMVLYLYSLFLLRRKNKA